LGEIKGYGFRDKHSSTAYRGNEKGKNDENEDAYLSQFIRKL